MKAIRDTHENIYGIELCNWKKKRNPETKQIFNIRGTE